ncbi:hypothetical protein N0V93_005419 [Gnomoniopsis smithogilvyi]|uniref:Sialidase domain-containing protein n=1 Tax=Gnomoniopsis smithogilvyi TaxID=1191159 RepID=A0A9W8YWL5_9PEZI|nr:hypothetical protein N0V93_005419 [Gnomoniopsis smithogilvyi]
MALLNPSRRTLGIFSAALFIFLFLGLYRTATPSRPKPQLTDKLGLNNPPGQASGPGPPPASGPLDTLHTTGRVLAEDLVFHDAPATYPRLTRLADGSILLAFTRLEPPTRILTVKRSVDNGRTFEPWGEVTRCNGDCGNLFLLEVPATKSEPQTRVLAAFRNHDVVDPKANRHLTYFRITVCESLDGGRTWQYVSQAAEKPAPMGLWEPFMRIGGKGEIQMTYSQELEPKDQDSIMRVSYDQGKTWSASKTISGGDEKLRDGMTGIATTTDQGRPALVMIFETTRRGRIFSLEAMVSYDDGDTWGHRQVVFDGTPEGTNAGAPQIEAFANGGLAVVFMTDMDVEARKWPWKATVKIIFGGPLLDGKIQWRTPQDALPNTSLWPGIFKLSDTQLIAVCEHDKAIRGRILEWK